MSHYPFETEEEFDELLVKARNASSAMSFLKTLVANLDNGNITDMQFRDFVRNSMQGFPGIDYTKPERPRPPESKL